MTRCIDNIIIWSLVVLFMTAIILFIVFYLYLQYVIARERLLFTEGFEHYCENLSPIAYRQEVYVPFKNGVYERKLAVALFDIASNTGKSNCANILPLPNPPGFTEQLRVEGAEPINGQILMFAYIFWDRTLQHAVISFTGTDYISEWISNLDFIQVPATELNGYAEGVLVHRGFYLIYLSIRNKLWNWWNGNSSWVKNLYITGYSLGGALCTLCAYDFADIYDSEDRVPIHYSFGAPRSGNNEYARFFNIRMDHQSLRINNVQDVIPQLPLPVQDGYIYDQTGGNVPFNISLGNLAYNHTLAYSLFLPICPEAATCHLSL